MHELILGGGKGGRSRCAELRAKDGLQGSGQRALSITTATSGGNQILTGWAHRASAGSPSASAPRCWWPASR